MLFVFILGDTSGSAWGAELSVEGDQIYNLILEDMLSWATSPILILIDISIINL